MHILVSKAHFMTLFVLWELHLWLHSSAAILMRSALFRDITQRQVVIVYQRVGTTYTSHLQGSRSPRRKQNQPTNQRAKLKSTSLGQLLMAAGSNLCSAVLLVSLKCKGPAFLKAHHLEIVIGQSGSKWAFELNRRKVDCVWYAVTSP